MPTFFALVVSTVFSYLGWWIGNALLGPVAGLLLSLVTSAIGYYLGRRWHDQMLEP